MGILEALALGAAGGAVGAAVWLAHQQGKQEQRLDDHDRRFVALEANYKSIVDAIAGLRALIVGNGS